MWKAIAALGAFVLLIPVPGRTAPLSMESVNAVAFSPQPAKPKGKAAKAIDPVLVKVQVLLDRAGFSPGAIDGHDGENVQRALAAFQEQNGLQPTGALDEATWTALAATSADPVLTEYEITEHDANGPYVKRIPPKLEAKAKLKSLGYASAREMLSERFHMDQDLLRALNPKASFSRAGDRIVVASVPQSRDKAKVTRIEVRKNEHTLRAFDQDGKLVAFYPASVGSEEKPAPIGSWTVQRVVENPTYHYDPKFKFKGVKATEKFTVAPGPNNPVGVVWIDLSADTYGIHGTPDPSRIGKTTSNGCIRLTNWDVKALAKMVAKGTAVEIVE